MIEDIQILTDKGCSREFIQIVEKYNNYKNSLDCLGEFIEEIEEYKKSNQLSCFEEDVLESAKDMHSSSYSKNIDSFLKYGGGGEDAIKEIEKDYNGDTFTAEGYEFNTDDGRRY